MKRSAGAMMLLAALGGCMSTEHKPSMMDSNNPAGGNGHQTIANVQGPWGQPVPYNPARAAGAGAPASADGVVTAGYTPGAIDNLRGTGTDNGVVCTNFTRRLCRFRRHEWHGACVANAGGGMMS